MTSAHQYAGKTFTLLVIGTMFLPASPATARAGWETVVDGTSFKDTTAFESKWSYNYPWGTDHNGTARMNETNITVVGGVVTLTSLPAGQDEGRSHSSPHLNIRYNSGTFYLKQKITIGPEYPVWDFSGQFKVPTETGTWPAFWITGAKSWPPESDFMEFKGTAECHQNTYNGHWQAKITGVPQADTIWHSYRAIATLENSTNVAFQYFVDGVLTSEQTANTFVGSPCWLIVDYQMEGDSGSPGPTDVTRFSMTNIVVKREDAGQ